MDLKSKYSIGDTVYQAVVLDTVEKLQCPDCLGTQEWKVILPSGETHTTNCQRCRDTWEHELPRMAVTDWRADVRKLTIGSVRFDSYERYDKYHDPYTYMCKETGVGSGNVYRENQLYSTKEEALREAETTVLINRTEREKKADVKAARKISVHGFAKALLKKAELDGLKKLNNNKRQHLP